MSLKPEYLIGGVVLVALGTGGVFISQTPEPDSVAPIVEVSEEVPRVAPPLLDAPVNTPTGEQKSVIEGASKKASLYKRSPELVAPDGYINTRSTSSGQAEPITIGEFLGKKVVLVDIWTYSCINCQRTLPYLKDWYSKYSDKGLEIIGVHTPEFAFEKLLKNVQQAVTEDGITYPVVLDNAYKTWNAFGNQYWPRKYLIDIDGYIVYDHAGEGAYAETEKAIQKALAERAERLGISVDTSMAISGNDKSIESELRKVQSPETYFGAERNDRLGNALMWTEGDQTLTMPATIKANAAYLSGTWSFFPEYAKNKTAGAEIRYQYNAKSVYFVASAASPVRLKVTRDGGQPLGAARGASVNAEGEVTIQKNGLYKLIEDSEYGVHTIEIRIEGVGLEAYTFTFG